jgi:hypothetical protein
MHPEEGKGFFRGFHLLNVGSGYIKIISLRYLTRIIHAPLLPSSSPPKKGGTSANRSPDERFSSWDCSDVTRFHVSALCQGLSRTASRRTGLLVGHHHHGSNEVERLRRAAQFDAAEIRQHPSIERFQGKGTRKMQSDFRLQFFDPYTYF